MLCFTALRRFGNGLTLLQLAFAAQVSCPTPQCMEEKSYRASG